MQSFIIRRFFTSLLALSIATMAIFAMSRSLGDPRINLLPEQGYGFDQEELEKDYILTIPCLFNMVIG